jgi:hypothetical protein
MEHNPYYDESLGQSHIDPNAALHAAQLHALQVQETDRLRQLDLQVHQGFTGLQAVSDQVAPHPHHQGPGWGTVAAIGTLAYLAARNSQQAPAQPVQAQTRPRGGKGNVWGWYVLLAFVLHLLLWLLVTPYEAVLFGPAFWLIGTAVWVPAWILTYVHQSRVSRHNAKLAASE